jgi:sterol desaturase/sphingolipid hydroxylase (fatty acid hydroxylase superfamily)
VIAPLAAFGLGAVGWTLAEYLLHRFVFHGASATRLGAVEHRKHHAQVDYFAPWWQKALAAVAATAVMLPVSVVAGGAVWGVAFTTGFIGMYLLYEVLHRRAHTRGPRGAYGRWRRRNHFAHHFADPRRAQGVTTPLWDRVFATRLPVERVRVPRRLAMPWLVDANGEIWPAYAGDYELVGSARNDARTRQDDTRAAMENRIPTVGTDGPTAHAAR